MTDETKGSERRPAERLKFHDFRYNYCTIHIRKNVSLGFSWALNSANTKTGQKFSVWVKQGSRHEKLNSRSRGFNSRAFYAHVRLCFYSVRSFCSTPSLLMFGTFFPRRTLEGYHILFPRKQQRGDREMFCWPH